MRKYFVLSGVLLCIILLVLLNLRINSFKQLILFPKQIEKITIQQEIISEKQKTTVILAGDMMLGRTVMTKSLSLNDYAYPFRKVAGKLKEADLVFANLENPVIADCPKMDTGMIFCASPMMLEGLVIADVNIVSLANNHARNFGDEGYESTKKFLSEKGISWVDERHLTIKEVGGIKFGFLGFDFTVKNPTDEDFNLVKESKRRTDVLILGVHWGVEYTSKPTATQKAWARRFVENGADIIAGHHQHWVQDVEYINGVEARPIYYSLGNLVFDQMWSEETKKGIVVELVYQNKELIDQKIYKTYMYQWSQPEFVE